MAKLVIRQAEVIGPDTTKLIDLSIENEQIHFQSVSSESHSSDKTEHDEAIDARNCYVTAGLFDLQVNGSPQCNLWADPNRDQFAELCLFLLKAGVTAFLPTLITDDLEHLKKNIHFLESMCGNYAKESHDTAIGSGKSGNLSPLRLIMVPGIHLEGPYLSPQRAGVHPKQYLRQLLMSELSELAKLPVKLITLAPELENGGLAIEYLLKQGIIPALGHSNATFDEAHQAFAKGVPMVTHTFNALPPIHHRQPGAVAAALLAQDVYCCLIADGLHVHPDIVKLLVKLKGKDRVILVSDMASVGTVNGGLIGSSISLSQAVVNMVNWGAASFPEAVQMATLNPACVMKLDNSLGQIKDGGRADLVIWQKQPLKIKHVIARGQLII